MTERHIDLPDHGVSFDLPDVINARTMLRFHAAWGQLAQGALKDLVFVNRWSLINELGLLTNWKCEYLPNPDVNLLEIEDERVGYMIIALLNTLYFKILALREVPKNV